jgi:hypothetical protein
MEVYRFNPSIKLIRITSKKCFFLFFTKCSYREVCGDIGINIYATSVVYFGIYLSNEMTFLLR